MDAPAPHLHRDAVLNQARHIVGHVESVMGQVYPDVEHIVIDGGSTDGPWRPRPLFPI